MIKGSGNNDLFLPSMLNLKQKNGPQGPVFQCSLNRGSDCDDVLSLRPFLALSHCELHLLTFGQGFEAVTSDSAEVGENVRAAFLFDKAKAFSFVKPFNGASSRRHNNILVLDRSVNSAGKMPIRFWSCFR